MINQYKSYVFNFSYSFFGGGLKRILAYLHWFNDRGGASFVLNNRLKGIEKKFPSNHYCFLHQNSIERVINYSSKLNKFINEIGMIDLYYSYGVPLPYKPGKVNWMHIANVLTLINPKDYVSFRRSLELRLLGLLISKGIKHADVISAESESSLNLFGRSPKNKLVVSVNGSDEEIATHKNKLDFEDISHTKNIAVAVGTCQYKCIDDVYKIYLYLRETNPGLNLVIAGIKDDVPSYIRKDNLVILQGILPQQEVCNLLKNAKYYITATLIENSYNAASEGVFLAKETFMSDIGPHRELLKNVKYEVLNNLGTRLASLHVTRKDMDFTNLKSWDQVINEMINTSQNILKRTGT